MGRVVVTEFVSLDGVMEDPGGAEGFTHAGWTFRFSRGADGDRFKLDELVEAEAQLLGRVTYEAFARAWPTMEDPVGFADKMNSMRKYVVSTTLRDEDATWNNSTVIRGDIVREIAALRGRLVGDLLVAGSATLVQTLIEHRLVDEFRLMLFPIVLGSGKRLFGDVSVPPTMLLDDVKTVGEGIVILTYRSANVEADSGSGAGGAAA